MTECQKNHRYNNLFSQLPLNQGSDRRHKCAGCAYEIGYLDGFNSNPPQLADNLNLLNSQAGTTRHKDAQTAYNWGYNKGQNDRL